MLTNYRIADPIRCIQQLFIITQPMNASRESEFVIQILIHVALPLNCI